MFSSLRSRLSLTFGLVALIVLCTATLMVALVIRNIPARTSTIRLQEISRLIYAREEIAGLSLTRQIALMERLADRNDIRLLIVGRKGEVLYDTGVPEYSPIERIPSPSRSDSGREEIPAGSFRDSDRRLWQFIMRPIDERVSLVMAEPRPAIQWLNLFRDDLLAPLLWSAGFAMLLSILLAGLTARWVARPLGKIAEAARGIPEGRFERIDEDGPQEVQQLSLAFNKMIAQVEAGRQSQRDFVANVSHELKTPLTGIQGFAQAVLDGTASTDEEIKKAAGVIYDDAGRMHHLVLDLLDLARFEGRTAAFNFASLQVAPLLDLLAEKFQPQCREAQVTLAVRHSPLPTILGDGDRLMQVFSNLLDNAIKNSPAGSQVEIRSGLVESDVQLEFIDAGTGIPPEEIPRIFERFYQLDKSRAHRRGAGFGLGLAIAREIVEAHGGRISVQSSPGRGSNFMVQLPSNTAGDVKPAAAI